MKEIDEHSEDLLKRMTGCDELPEPLADVYRRVRIRVDRVSGGGAISPVVLALLPELVGRLDDEAMASWKQVPVGAAVVCDWNGRREGVFMGIGKGKMLRIKIGPRTQNIRAKRVKLKEALHDAGT